MGRCHIQLKYGHRYHLRGLLLPVTFCPDGSLLPLRGVLRTGSESMVVNLGKAGSSIPLKWQLRAEGGGFVSALFAVKINSPTQIGCSEAPARLLSS